MTFAYEMAKRIGRRWRILGDRHRDRREWKAAAAAYRTYLSIVPKDVGIRVQLGHMLSEMRDYSGADVAYAQAFALAPNDSDLILCWGHSRKASGDPARARELYVLSAAIDQNSDAVRELSLIPPASEPRRTPVVVAAAVDPAVSSAELVALNDYQTIVESGLFDQSYYFRHNPDVAQAGCSAIDHFCRFGWREARNPTPLFNVQYYLSVNDDVRHSGINPFVHWLVYGRNEGRPGAEPKATLFAGGAFLDTVIAEGAFNPSIIFVSHEASRTGAPTVLLSMLRWIKANTDIQFGIIIGADGPMRSEFEELAPCFLMDKYTQDVKRDKLREFCGINVQVVYLNTIVSGIYGANLTFLNAHFVTHVHEMENVFALFEGAFNTLCSFCSDFIAVSEGSVEAIKRRTADNAVRITQIAPFVDDFADDGDATAISRSSVPVIYACGTSEARKGPDLFCDVAERLIADGVTQFRMRWIGPQASYDIGAEIAGRGLGKHVEWLGPQSNPRRLYADGAIFVLTSREDPFPLACLEAAERGLPIICFDERAGSMHSFVEDDAGIVVDYLDTAAMADAIKRLLKDDVLRSSFGERARQKMAERHLTEVIGPKILALIPPLLPSSATSELDAYKEQIDRAEMVSFDIFDTLITRRLSNPATVFDLVEHRHSRNESAVLGLFDERMRVAGEVLGKYVERDDVSLDEIYEAMPFFKDSAHEKTTEIDVVVPHPLGLELYRYAQETGKRVILASDMYLDETTICSMLAKCGFANWDKLFLSSSLGLKKDTGRLFSALIDYARDLGIGAADILHIGDNWEGDIAKAHAAGLKAIRFIPLYDKSTRKFPLGLEPEQKLSQIGRIWNDFTTQAAKLWAENDPEASSDFYAKLGFEVTGPLASMMAMHVRAQADKLGATKIVFMARDGRIIKKAFEALYREEIAAGRYRSVYAHLSRAVVIPATLHHPLRSSDLYFLIEGLHLGQKTIRYFIEKAGLDPLDAVVVQIVNRRFAGMNVVPQWQDLLAMTLLMQDLSEQIFNANSSMREKFAAYLKKMGLDQDETVLMVDVGWLLNIQSRIQSFCDSVGSPMKSVGIYVGSRERVDKSIPHSSLLFDGGDPRHYAEFIEANTTLFEVLFSAPESSASGLGWNADGEVEVTLKPLSMPRSKEFLVAQKLHFGAETYFGELATALKSFMPERISKDFFFSAFQALVNSSDDDAHREFGHFEVLLGGHHEFATHQALMKGPTPVARPTAAKGEYFAPVTWHPGTQKAVAIVTSAGLNNGSTRYRGLNLGHSLAALDISSTLFHSATPLEAFETGLAGVDTVVFQRCFKAQDNVGAMLNLAKRLGKRCVMEIDDLVFPDFLPIIGSVVGGEWNYREALLVSTAYKDFMDEMDGAIASTQVLRSTIADRWKIPTALYRNRVQQIGSDQISAADTALRMIYASGTYSHKEDIMLVEAEIRRVLQDHPDAHLSLLGATQVPPELMGLPNVSSYPLLPYKTMLSLIARHNLMIVPLVDNLFNHAKSSVKFVEAASVGVPVLASNVTEYAAVINDGQNGLLAATHSEWSSRLTMVAERPEMLRSLGDGARDLVARDYVCSAVDEQTATGLRAVLFGQG